MGLGIFMAHDDLPPILAHPYAHPRQRLIFSYVWVFFRNLIGWVLLISIPFVGWIPGPNAIIQFIIGFALISLPGKRQIMARVMRGKPIPRGSRAYRNSILILAVLLPALAIGYMWWSGWPVDPFATSASAWIALAAYVVAVPLLAWIGIRGLWFTNKFLSGVPIVRRWCRPWLRHHGFDLLPPRRRHRGAAGEPPILRVNQRLTASLRRLTNWLIRKLRIPLGVVVVGGIFYWMLKPIVERWPAVRERVLATDWRFFGMAVGMFTIAALVFRATAWRWVLRGLGHRLHPAPAMRIWSTSELVRYIPGLVWQILGRVYLVKPYGIGAAVCSASQVLEITIYVLANVLIAATCLLVAGLRHLSGEQQRWVYLSVGLVPVLLLLLHPRVFYGTLNAILRWFRKAPVVRRLSEKALVGLTAWSVLGLLWQSLAIWLLTAGFLDLPLSKWWALAGSYSLAWTVGFCFAFMAPAGIGIREAVFIKTLRASLPPDWVAMHLSDEATQAAVIGVLAILLRLWTVCGELLMGAIAYAIDYRGALGRPSAPGRLPQEAGR